VILAGSHAGEQELARFYAEAEAAARLQHPNIVAVYEVGESEGRPFLALEFVDGPSLAARLAGTPQPPAGAARLAEVLARAVDHAHERGVVHRDLKPANVLLAGSEGERRGVSPPVEDALDRLPDAAPLANCVPKIADFGLAKRTDMAGLTASGAIVGTPSYMAPEQAAGKGREVGPAADVYALGAILYECLTGRPPFLGATAADTLLQVVSQEPVPPRRLQPGVPRDLETICLKCLRKDAARRYASARDLADDLRSFLDGQPIRARPVGTAERLARWCRRNPALAALTAALAALLVGTAVIATVAAVRIDGARAEAERSAEEARQALGRESQAAAAADRARQRAVLGKREVEKEQQRAEASLYFNRVSLAERYWSGNNVGLADAKLNECAPRLHDWEWHYLKRLCHAAHSVAGPLGQEGPGVAFSPDGSRVASACADRHQVRNLLVWGVKVWDAATGQQLFALTTGGPFIPSFTAIHGVAYSADGKRLAAACGDGTVLVWSKVDEGTEDRPLLVLRGHTGACRSVAFSPDGKRLATGGADHTVRVWDANTGRVLAKAFSREVQTVAFSRDGKRLASGGADNTVRLWEFGPDGKSTARHTLLGHKGHVRALAFSPDGNRLASASVDGTVKVWDSAGRELAQAAGHAGPVNAVAFSPDGSRLASASDDWAVKVWDAATGKELFTLRGHSAPVRAVGYRGGGRELAAVAGDDLKVWEATTGGQGLRLPGDSTCVALRPDGRQVATARGSTVTVWDTTTGREVSAWPRHRGTVVQVAFSPGGRRLLVGSAFGPAKERSCQVRAWDLATGKAVLTALSESGDLGRVAFSTDGRYAAAVVGMRTLCTWDLATGERHNRGGGDAAFLTVEGLAFSADGRLLAVAGSRRFLVPGNPAAGVEPGEPVSGVEILERATGTRLGSFVGHDGAIRALAFGRAGRRDLLATAGTDRVVKVWDVSPFRAPHRAERRLPHEPLWTLTGHTRPVQGLAFSPDGKRLLSISAGEGETGGEVKVWDVDWGQEVLTLPGAGGAVSFSQASGKLAVAGADGIVRVWDGTPRRDLFTRPDTGLSVAFGPDGRLATTGWGTDVTLWDVQLGRPTVRLRGVGQGNALGHTDVVRRGVFSPHGRRLATAGEDGTVKLWEASSGKVLRTLRGHREGVLALAFSRDGSRVVSAGSDEEVRVWDVHTGGALVCRGHTDRVLGMAFSPDGRSVASGGEDRTLRVWDPRTGRLRYPPRWHENVVNAVAFSPDGTLLASACEDGTVRLWRAADGKEVRTLREHTDGVRDVVFSPDGKRLATACWDQKVRLWETATGRVVLTLEEPGGGVTSVSFSPDGKRLATACADRTVRVWDVVP
jgi:WD40 repeat protein